MARTRRIERIKSASSAQERFEEFARENDRWNKKVHEALEEWDRALQEDTAREQEKQAREGDPAGSG